MAECVPQRCPIFQRLISSSRQMLFAQPQPVPEYPLDRVMPAVGSWLREHEDAQVMVASLLVVLGIWWVVKSLLTLVINLVCPVIFGFVAVMCVPQLREALLGQNYDAVANVLRTILLRLADKLKT